MASTPKVTAQDLLNHFAVLKGIGPRKARRQRVRARIRTRMIGGQNSIRVLADDSPGDAFEPAPPDLEDVYFVALMNPETNDAP